MSFATNSDILLYMSMILFGMGVIISLTGVGVLMFRAMGRDVRTLAAQTTKLVQKGLAEEVAGLVGNASSLLEAVNQLIRTAAGVGVFLTIFGLVMMVAACLIALKVY